MISVIIPAFNREKTIERAVRSVLNQTYSDVEVIVVDDGSTDNTSDVVKSIVDDRLIYHALDKNSGACIARNKGIAMAKGDYIAFQDSDDEWLENKLEIQLKKMLENHAEISFCQFRRFDSKGISVSPQIGEGIILRDDLLKESVVSTQTILAKRECFSEILFDPQMPRMQDYDICIRLSEKYNFYFVKSPLVNMYVQNDSISTDWEKLYIALETIFKKYPDTIKRYKQMDFYQTRYFALAKEKTGRDSKKERFHCFLLKPSRRTIKKLIKSLVMKKNRN